MGLELNETITDFKILSIDYRVKDDFAFTSLTFPNNIYDAILIKINDSVVYKNCYGYNHTIEEYVEYINRKNIEKAIIMVENLQFLDSCSNLKHIFIISNNAVLDFSPVYRLKKLKSFRYVPNCDVDVKKVDCMEFESDLEDINIDCKYFENFEKMKKIKSLGISNLNKLDLTEVFSSSNIDTLFLMSNNIISLKGLETNQDLMCLYLYYNKNLYDISNLEYVSNSLKALRIDNCNRIQDFSVLDKLNNLEMLELSGKNKLPNLHFLKKLKKLKTFVFNMDVEDGDLSLCLNLSYACCINVHQNYNLKDKDLPKNKYYHGNENIDEWRRLY